MIGIITSYFPTKLEVCQSWAKEFVKSQHGKFKTKKMGNVISRIYPSILKASVDSMDKRQSILQLKYNRNITFLQIFGKWDFKLTGNQNPNISRLRSELRKSGTNSRKILKQMAPELTIRNLNQRDLGQTATSNLSKRTKISIKRTKLYWISDHKMLINN